MRLSTNELCQRAGCLQHELAVFVDDVLMDGFCLAADPEEGWVDLLVEDVHGNLKIDAATGRPAILRRHGRVDLRRWAPRARRAQR